jgi:hypothetical protein
MAKSSKRLKPNHKHSELKPRRCAWKECREWFVPGSRKQRYHTPRCAQRDRQTKWYREMRRLAKEAMRLGA